MFWLIREGVAYDGVHFPGCPVLDVSFDFINLYQMLKSIDVL